MSTSVLGNYSLPFLLPVRFWSSHILVGHSNRYRKGKLSTVCCATLLEYYPDALHLAAPAHAVASSSPPSVT